MGKIFTVLAATFWAAAILTVALAEQADNATPPVDLAAPPKQVRDANHKILKAMKQPVSLKLENESWETLAEKITQLIHVPVQLDREGLSSQSEAEKFLSGEFQDIPIGTALARLLEPRELTWCVKDECIVLTSRSNAGERYTEVQVYNVAPLVAAGYKSSDLLDAIDNFVPGPWENIDGEGGTTNESHDALLIKNASNVQRDVSRLIELIQSAAQRKDAPAGAIYGIDADDARIVASLSEKLDVAYDHTPLVDVAADLQEKLKVPVHLDAYEIERVDTAGDYAVTLKAKGISAEAILDVILPPRQLTAEVHRGRLLITTARVGKFLWQPIVFDVSDFIAAKFSGDDVIDAVINNTAGPWESVGGDGASDPEVLNSRLLVVKSSSRNQRDVAFLLDDLRTKYVSSKLEALKAEPVPDPNTVRTEIYKDLPAVVQELHTTIPLLIQPKSWKHNGGAGMIQGVGKTLVIQQTNAVHDEIRTFLAKLKESTQAGSGPSRPGGNYFFSGKPIH